VKRLPRRLVLLGHPVAHSLSPVLQNAALRRVGIPLTYQAWDVMPDDLVPTLDELVREAGAGNVTLPYKEVVARRCDRLTPWARCVGAANTFWVDPDGALVGDNTDVGGFRRLLADTLPRGRAGPQRLALLGAGGAAAAVLAAVERLAVPVTLHNRTVVRAEGLRGRFPGVVRVSVSAEEAVQAADVVVNATSVGLHDDGCPVAVSALADCAVVLDLVYRRGDTAWVRAARAAGHVAADGLGMLLEQGALAFERWFGIPAPRAVMAGAIGYRGVARGRGRRAPRG
jgi:shikimate dehydrogenase